MRIAREAKTFSQSIVYFLTQLFAALAQESPYMSTLLTYFDRGRHGESSPIFCAAAGDFANAIVGGG
jgi:hypothetical protein